MRRVLVRIIFTVFYRTAILRYLCRTREEDGDWYPREARAQTRVDEILAWLPTGLRKATFELFQAAVRFTPDSSRTPPDALSNPTPNQPTPPPPPLTSHYILSTTPKTLPQFPYPHTPPPQASIPQTPPPSPTPKMLSSQLRVYTLGQISLYIGLYGTQQSLSMQYTACVTPLTVYRHAQTLQPVMVTLYAPSQCRCIYMYIYNSKCAQIVWKYEPHIKSTNIIGYKSKILSTTANMKTARPLMNAQNREMFSY